MGTERHRRNRCNNSDMKTNPIKDKITSILRVFRRDGNAVKEINRVIEKSIAGETNAVAIEDAKIASELHTLQASAILGQAKPTIPAVPKEHAPYVYKAESSGVVSSGQYTVSSQQMRDAIKATAHLDNQGNLDPSEFVPYMRPLRAPSDHPNNQTADGAPIVMYSLPSVGYQIGWASDCGIVLRVMSDPALAGTVWRVFNHNKPSDNKIRLSDSVSTYGSTESTQRVRFLTKADLEAILKAKPPFPQLQSTYVIEAYKPEPILSGIVSGPMGDLRIRSTSINPIVLWD
jgi:hypothetical protein